MEFLGRANHPRMPKDLLRKVKRGEMFLDKQALANLVGLTRWDGPSS